jgi:hypothetical protein
MGSSFARIGLPKLMPTRKVAVGAKEERVEGSMVFMAIKVDIKKPRRTAVLYTEERITS